jgi:DNA uptake protein ComE-like DNA-binding protein
MMAKSSVETTLKAAGLGAVAAVLVMHAASAGELQGTATPWGALASVRQPAEQNEAQSLSADDKDQLAAHLRLSSSPPPAGSAGNTGAPSATPGGGAAQQAGEGQGAVPSSPESAAAALGTGEPSSPAPRARTRLALSETPKASAFKALVPSSTLVNINTAPADAINKIPGSRRVGHAIAAHRPYRTIDDLVRRRILRDSDFQRLKGHIKV